MCLLDTVKLAMILVKIAIICSKEKCKPSLLIVLQFFGENSKSFQFEIPINSFVGLSEHHGSGVAVQFSSALQGSAECCVKHFIVLTTLLVNPFAWGQQGLVLVCLKPQASVNCQKQITLQYQISFQLERQILQK